MASNEIQKLDFTDSEINLETCNEDSIYETEQKEVTLEYVQRLENEIAEKDKEIKLIKQKLIRDAKKCSPVCLF